MITLKLIPLAASTLLSTVNPTCPEVVYSLEDAIEQKKVTSEFVSRGTYNGESVIVKLENTGNKPIKIVVEQGLVFSPDESRAQDLIVPKTTVLALNDSESKAFNVEGYCIEAHDAAPRNGTGFTLYKTKNKELLELLSYFEKASMLLDHTRVVQNAIWSVSDKKSLSYLHSDEHSEDLNELRAFLSNLTGLPNVWYNTDEEIWMDNDRRIVSNAIAVKGEIKISLDKPMKVKGIVIDEHGEEVWAYPDLIQFPDGDVEFWFNLEVKHWTEGKYYIVYSSNNKTLLKQEFSI